MPGLGLLPTETVIEGEKVTRQVRFAFLSSEEPTCTGYEIHMGRTSAVEGETLTPLVRLENGETDGCVVDRKCAGSYIHGILDNPEVIEWLLAPYAEKRGAISAGLYRFQGRTIQQAGRPCAEAPEHAAALPNTDSK